MAQVLATSGYYKEAEKWQQRYVATRPSDLPQAYGFLGDVRLSRGDRVNARRAYQKGLDSMMHSISRGVASK
jgi:predicted negative regulator of RcsB-dependent stress response